MTEENKNTIIFRMGEETGVVTEKTKEQFEHSLFKEQYRQAFAIIDDITRRLVSKQTENAESTFSNIVAFCGDRGEGKTSALSTVRRVLQDKDTFREAKEAGIILSNGYLQENSCHCLPLVDPSFFDEQHNIVELVIGQMYEQVVQDNTGSQIIDGIQNGGYRPLMEKFAEAKKCLSALNQVEDLYDAISELSILAASVRLRKAIADLFWAYLQYYKKETLVISIDDIDLNMKEAYMMAENIRKYLCNKHCIILLAVKIEQLQKVIHSAIRTNVKDVDIVTNEQVIEMAHKYVTKFIPENHRVVMPSSDDIIEYIINMYGRDQQLLPNINKLPVKEAIVRLIFNKTRFLFYNSRSVSPIIPHNLREIIQLVGLLTLMPDIYDKYGVRKEETLLTNKVIFKNYFYNSWVKNNLTYDDRDFAYQLASYKDIISVNKFVVSYLNKRLDVGNASKGKIDDLYDQIVLPENKSHNISVGDVYYVIKQMDTITTDNKIKLLLFFVRSYYSMRLYELYDAITTPSELRDNFIGRSGSEYKVRIYKYDSLYEGTNVLQRFLNGSYFTYLPGSLINDISERTSRQNNNRDIRAINGQKLAQLLVSCNKKFSIYKQESKQENKSSTKLTYSDEFKRAVRRCEYFILCTTHQLDGYEAKRNRRMVNPPFIGTYDSISKKYLFYDFLAIFYNIVNVQYAFRRFGKDGKEFYRNVKKQPWSLTSQVTMLNVGETWPDKIERSKILWRYHKQLSDGCIRVSEVQQSIIEELTKNRLCNKHKETGENTYKLKNAYKDIQRLDISLYPYSDENKEALYRIPFNFLTPIINYLDKEKETEFNAIYLINASTSSKDRIEFYKMFPSAKKSRATNRAAIISILRANQPTLPESKDKLWKDIFPDDTYKKADWVERCITNMDKFFQFFH